MEQNYIITAFDSTHDAIKAEILTKQAKLTARLIPIPPEVSAGCGLALRAAPEEEGAVREILKAEGVKGEYYHLTRLGNKRRVERLED